MVSVISKIIQALAMALPALLSWWEKRQSAKDLAASEARMADLRSDPADAWMCKFNAQARPDDIADQAGADQSDNDK